MTDCLNLLISPLSACIVIFCLYVWFFHKILQRQARAIYISLLNSFLCPPGPPLPNPKASIKPKGWTLQCLTQLFLAPLWALHSPPTVLVLKNLTSEEYLQ